MISTPSSSSSSSSSDCSLSFLSFKNNVSTLVCDSLVNKNEWLPSSLSSSSSSSVTPPSSIPTTLSYDLHNSKFISYLSLLVLILFFGLIQQTAKPFLNPKGEARLALTMNPSSAASIYFYISSFLYLWIISSTALTILPHFTSHYNIIIASALYFTMFFITLIALVLGRGMIHYCIVSNSSWKTPSSHYNSSSSSSSKKPFYRPFRAIIKTSILLSSILSLLYAHCWSRTLNAFKIFKFQGSGAICRIVFFPFLQAASSSIIKKNNRQSFSWMITSTQGIHEQTIWLLWLVIILILLGRFTYLELYPPQQGKGRDPDQKRISSHALMKRYKRKTNKEENHYKNDQSSSSSSNSSSSSSLHGLLLVETKTKNEDVYQNNIHDDNHLLSSSMKRKVNKNEHHELHPITNTSFSFTNLKSTRLFHEKFTKLHRKEEKKRENKKIKNLYPCKESTSTTTTTYDGPLDTLPMVPWFSLLAARSLFDLLLQLKVFLGRFDARTMQPALRDFVDNDHHHKKMMKKKKNLNKKHPLLSIHHNQDDDDDDDADNNTSSSNSADDENYIHITLKKRYPGCYFYLSDEKKKAATTSSTTSVEDSSDDFWIDFCADTGDGFNSSYHVARMLAQQYIQVQDPKNGHSRKLPRGDILVIGGDLAYPDPNEESYEKRFFRTFEDAMQPPSSFRREAISTKKPALPVGGWHSCFDDMKQNYSHGDLLRQYNGPSAFIIPGNHDWFDGLYTFTRYICHRDWLGGWLIPQQRSYFALKLPMGWWIFAFDYALAGDIDLEQFKFFAEVSEKALKPSDAIIFVNHEPHWVTRRCDDKHERNVQELMDTYLAGKVRIRLAGDLHHYTRHTPVSFMPKPSRSRSRSLSWDEGNDMFSSNSVLEENRPELIVSGGGGAFCHGTHTFPHSTNVGPRNAEYVRVAAFPSEQVSFYLGWLNIFHFRWRNWRMDVVWAIIYLGIVSSLFPLCGIYADFEAFVHSYSPALLPIWTMKTILSLMLRIIMYEKASLGFCFMIILSTFLATDSKLRPTFRVLWGFIHGASHIGAALFCALLVECLTEWLLEEAIVKVPTVYDADGANLASSLNYEYAKHFAPLLPQSAATLFFKFFDIPSRIAKNHSEMCSFLCSGGVECLLHHDITRYRALIRGSHTLYFGAISLYFILLAIPFAGFIFGSWLALSLNCFKAQCDEGFSSLRIQNWKNFVKLRIKDDGEIEIFGVGLPLTPRKWRKDPCWGGREYLGSGEPSWLWKRPSKWIPEKDHQSYQPEVIDYTCVRKRRFLHIGNHSDQKSNIVH